MTRKKWNRLRRQHPGFFGLLPAWDCLNRKERNRMRRFSKARALAGLTEAKLNGRLDEYLLARSGIAVFK